MHDDSEAPEVMVVREQEVTRGWNFVISVGAGAERQSIQLRLDWADYNYWSQGRLSPAEVAAGVVACAVALLGVGKLPEQADAATLRRKAPGFEDQLNDFLDR